MKKTLLVSAVALAVSGNAMAAEMYGQVRVGLSTYQPPTTSPSVPLGTDELDVNSSKLVLGSKGSSDLGNGMTLSYHVELEHDAADRKTTGWANDRSWVAIGGNFGKVTAGRSPDLAGWACAGTDIFNFGTAEACELSHNTEYDNAIKYTGSAGALDFGYIFTADGTAVDDDSQVGVRFSGDSFTVAFVAASNEPAGTTSSQIGGTFQLGDITLGLTIGDNDAATDSGGIDFGVQMPLGAGNLAVLFSTLDVSTNVKGTVSDGDSLDLEYIASLGADGYYGIAFNSKDNWEEDRIVGYIGTNF